MKSSVNAHGRLYDFDPRMCVCVGGGGCLMQEFGRNMMVGQGDNTQCAFARHFTCTWNSEYTPTLRPHYHMFIMKVLQSGDLK